jgi:hypothetical protein
MTYRERRERRAERLRGWAQAREERAAAQLNSYPDIRHDIAFITQPGRIPFRERMNRADDRAFESLAKARGMSARADGIEAQLDHAIYSDDPDAIERLRERIAGLEAERAAIKARPHQAYELSNLAGNLRRQRERLAHLERVAAAKATAPDRVTVEPAENMPGDYLKVRFPEAPAYEIRQELKAANYFWHAGTQAWYGPAAALPASVTA